MKRFALLLLAVAPIVLYGQSDKDQKMAAIEKDFFESCKQRFDFVEKVYSAPYQPTPPSGFPPSTVELFVVVKDNVKDRYAMTDYMKAKRSSLNEITGRYTTLYLKNYESQLQILLYVVSVNTLGFEIE